MITNEGAYVISQSVCAMIEAMGMQAENQMRAVEGFSPAYDQKAFLGLIDNYGLGHNAVTEALSK